MQPSQRHWLYSGAVERYAQIPDQKPKMRFPWGIIIALLVLIAMYYFVNKIIF